MVRRVVGARAFFRGYLRILQGPRCIELALFDHFFKFLIPLSPLLVREF